MLSAFSLHALDRNRQKQRKVSFLYGETATTTTEYAVFLLILTVSAMAGFVTVSGITHFVFQQAYTAMLPVSAENNLPSSQSLIDRALGSLVQNGSHGVTRLDFFVTVLGGLLGLFFAVILVMSFMKPRHRKTQEHPQQKHLVVQQLREIHRRVLYAKRNLLRRVLGRSLDERRVIDLPVEYFMSEQVEAVAPDTPLERVRHIMRRKGIRHLIVADESNQPLGIISSHDLRCRSGSTARDAMTAEPYTVGPEVPISQAITLLLQHGISCLPVVQNGKLAGILTTTDILIGFQALIQAWELVHQPPADIEEPEATECDGNSALTISHEDKTPRDASSAQCVC